MRSVLFGGASAPPTAVREIEGTVTQINIEETAEALKNAESVIIVPGYGMAVAKAQFAIAEMVKSLQSRGVRVRFAIHPVGEYFPSASAVSMMSDQAGVPQLAGTQHVLIDSAMKAMRLTQ